ncbi:MAG: FecR domain-containing protein [Gammaproteobacteria bacterium]
MKSDPVSVAPQIIDEASEWFIAMREPTASLDQRAAFVDWLRRSPVHMRVYLEIVELWGDAADLDPEFESTLEATIHASQARDNVVPLRDYGDTSLVDRSDRTPRHRPHPSLAWRVAASVLVTIGIAVAAGVWWNAMRGTLYATDIGEQKTFVLDDGSVAKLDARSRLRVRMSAASRQVELVEGQALFEVTKNPRRPFIVHSGTTSVRAVGTAFDVDRTSRATVVTVVEGRVEVRSRTDDEPDGVVATADRHSVVLVAGERVSVAPASGEINRVTQADTAGATTSTQRELVFSGEPLASVVEKFNRYTRRTIVLSDPALADLRINAVFRSTNPESLLLFLGRIDGIEIQRTAAEIRISKKVPQS